MDMNNTSNHVACWAEVCCFHFEWSDLWFPFARQCNMQNSPNFCTFLCIYLFKHSGFHLL